MAHTLKVHSKGILENSDGDDQLRSLDDAETIQSWRKFSDSEFRVILDPLSAHGLWSKREPFNLQQESRSTNGPVVAITRARIAARRYLAFLKVVPPVIEHLHSALGLLKAFGIGEAPIGLQGTFSLWRDEASLLDFAFKDSAHREAVSASHKGDWFTEELFARFTVREMRDTL